MPNIAAAILEIMKYITRLTKGRNVTTENCKTNPHDTNPKVQKLWFSRLEVAGLKQF